MSTWFIPPVETDDDRDDLYEPQAVRCTSCHYAVAAKSAEGCEGCGIAFCPQCAKGGLGKCATCCKRFCRPCLRESAGDWLCSECWPAAIIAELEAARADDATRIAYRNALVRIAAGAVPLDLACAALDGFDIEPPTMAEELVVSRAIADRRKHGT